MFNISVRECVRECVRERMRECAYARISAFAKGSHHHAIVKAWKAVVKLFYLMKILIYSFYLLYSV